MKWLFLLILPFSFCFSVAFTDSYSGLSLSIPDSFHFEEKDRCGAIWWYAFRDDRNNELVLEIEEYNHQKTHPEHFHKSLTNEKNDKEEMVYQGLEFEHFSINELEVSKCKLRIVAIADENMYHEPLYLCDYLFVRDHFGFTLSLMKKGNDHVDNEIMMKEVLSSMRFGN